MSTAVLTAHGAVQKPGLIMWDMDGIGFQWTRYFNVWNGRDADEVWTSWHHAQESWGMTLDEFLAENASFGKNGGFRHGEPYPDFVEAFQRLQSHPLITSAVITDKPGSEAMADCVAWLDDLGCTPDWIVSSRDKTYVLEFKEPYHIVFGIDDHPGHVRAMLAKGIRAALRDRPWNRAADYQDLPRVHSLHEFADGVEMMLQ